MIGDSVACAAVEISPKLLLKLLALRSAFARRNRPVRRAAYSFAVVRYPWIGAAWVFELLVTDLELITEADRPTPTSAAQRVKERIANSQTFGAEYPWVVNHRAELGDVSADYTALIRNGGTCSPHHRDFSPAIVLASSQTRAWRSDGERSGGDSQVGGCAA